VRQAEAVANPWHESKGRSSLDDCRVPKTEQGRIVGGGPHGTYGDYGDASDRGPAGVMETGRDSRARVHPTRGAVGTGKDRRRCVGPGSGRPQTYKSRNAPMFEEQFTSSSCTCHEGDAHGWDGCVIAHGNRNNPCAPSYPAGRC
jgi:hypothetical protein